MMHPVWGSSTQCDLNNETDIYHALEDTIIEQKEKDILNVTKEQALIILRKYWGHNEFRENQFEVIKHVLNKLDSFVMLSTGSGKSLIFQLPALLSGKTVVVISPLISLMEDQTARLIELGISTIALNSVTEDKSSWFKAWKGEYQVVFIAPETLPNCLDGIQQLVQLNRLCLFSIDESHCVSEFGFEFRPAYRQLHVLKEKFPQIPLLSVTATATKEVQEDIIKQLKLKDPLIIRSTVNRPNVDLRIALKTHYEQDLTKELLGKESCIIYCLTKAETEEIAIFLSQKLGLKAKAYHAGLDSTIRKQVHHAFIKDELQIVCGTSAFSMGLDKPDIRLVINWGLVKALESFVQMSGRAGRDGIPSKSIMFWSNKDISTIEFFMSQVNDPIAQQRDRKLFTAMKNFAMSNNCRRQSLMLYFDEEHSGHCGSCDNCTPEALNRQLHNITEMARLVSITIEETGCRFAAGLIIDILRGTNSKEVNTRITNPCTTASSLKALNKLQVQALINLLVHQGVLVEINKKTPSGFSYKTLNIGKEALKLIQDPDYQLPSVQATFLDRTTTTNNTNNNLSSSNNVPFTKSENILHTLLTNWRNEEAKRKDIAPYMILDANSLNILTRTRPTDIEHLILVNGIGEKKTIDYGKSIIRIILDACAEYEMSSNLVSTTKTAVPTTLFPQKSILLTNNNQTIDPIHLMIIGGVKRNDLKRVNLSELESLRLLDPLNESCIVGNAQLSILYLYQKQKQTIEQISLLREIQAKTVLTYLSECILSGFVMDYERFHITNEEEKQVQDEITKADLNQSLINLQKTLNNKIDGGKIAIIRARFLRKHNKGKKRKKINV